MTCYYYRICNNAACVCCIAKALLITLNRVVLVRFTKSLQKQLVSCWTGIIIIVDSIATTQRDPRGPRCIAEWAISKSRRVVVAIRESNCVDLAVRILILNFPVKASWSEYSTQSWEFRQSHLPAVDWLQGWLARSWGSVITDECLMAGAADLRWYRSTANCASTNSRCHQLCRLRRLSIRCQSVKRVHLALVSVADVGARPTTDECADHCRTSVVIK